ncbi:hypothetical protein [Priestia megaterium]|uniref:hypothetical protein n=1 Tax=Priestia megaterium TaxID=1404 RepID=UPI00112C2744|nr:hypothetical protein [Priestia megaterium]TPF18028.1 hypothetical protein CBE78_02035 [Priestia megaterium]TPF22135.1 hypothetical protein CBE79_04540 [Priestia megaterium]
MRFVEKNKHRTIEKDTMELAMSWYYRYREKEEQIETIEKNLIAFESQMMSMENKGIIDVAEFQKIWNRTVKL